MSDDLGLGMIHALTISTTFARYESFGIKEPDKFLLAVVAVPVVLLFRVWRIVVACCLCAKGFV